MSKYLGLQTHVASDAISYYEAHEPPVASFFPQESVFFETSTPFASVDPFSGCDLFSEVAGFDLAFDLTAISDSDQTNTTYTTSSEWHLAESTNNAQTVLELNEDHSRETGQSDPEDSEGDVDPP
jgi:hypothetical protein